MKNDELLKLYGDFRRDYDEEAKSAIWDEHSKRFQEFWKNRIMNQTGKELTDAEIDEIVRILDRNGKGNAGDVEAVAKAMIAQGMWRRMFREFRQNAPLREVVNGILFEEDEANLVILIDKLYRLNEGHKNSLTGKSGNAINAMMVACHPRKYVHVISLGDRQKVIEYFKFPSKVNFEQNSQGRKIVSSNRIILEGFKSLGLSGLPRTVSKFLYSPFFKGHWKTEAEIEQEVLPPPAAEAAVTQDPGLFYMESQLEDFLMENWDRTELGAKYDLIEENGEIVSQQFKTDIGKIDILARDKQGQYVVIELKKNQTSDDTVGQLTRYMGWLEEHKTKGRAARGIIIAGGYDERLRYALKKVKDVEVYLYKVDFKLDEFKKAGK